MSAAELPEPVADLEFVDRAVLLGDVLVCADLHLGLGPSAGLDLPVGTGSRTVERLEVLLERTDPTQLVLAGDVLHAFDTVPRPVRRVLDRLADVTVDRGTEMFVLAGNHDRQLGHLWDGPVGASHRVGDTLVCHGHERPDATADRYVIGHEHPVLKVAGRRRPCYLAGAGVADGADVVVLPAFSRILRGVRVDGLDAGGLMSPLLPSPDDLEPVVWDEDGRDALAFPPVADLRDRL